MQDPPTIAELLQAAAAFLREVAVPQLSGHASFHARVAANALDIVTRELELRPAAERNEHARLKALLDSDGSLEELNSLLSRRIAAGELGCGRARFANARSRRAPVGDDAGEGRDRSTHVRVVPARNRKLTSWTSRCPPTW
jgi:hypothetical protein